ncbi:MAG: translocation/assembly module TamB domain-containing protein [Deltaproteobacteria bacterium]|nr:translocation/assembly module TamB domain-containing protein [Deltaproteobacteria bacterium]
MRKRWIRVLAWTPVLSAFLLGVAMMGLLGLLRTERGNDWLLGQVLRRVQPAAGRIEVDRLRTDVLSWVQLDGVRIVDPDGNRRVAAESVRAELSPLALLAAALPVHDLAIRGLDVQLDGGDFDRMWPSTGESKPWAGLPFALDLRHVTVDGRVRVRDWSLAALSLEGKASVSGRVVTWTDFRATASLRGLPLAVSSAGRWTPGLLVVEPARAALGTAATLSAAGVLRDRSLAFDLTSFQVEPLALAPLLPALAESRLKGRYVGAASIGGTLAAPELRVDLSTPGGPASATLSADTVARPLGWRVDAQTPGLDLAQVVDGVEPVNLGGWVRAQGSGTAWPGELQARADLDAIAYARGERLHITGTASLADGKVRSDGLTARTGWAEARLSGELDAVARTVAARVAYSRVELRRLGLEGTLSFTGGLTGQFAQGLSGHATGSVNGSGLAARGARLDLLGGTVDLQWDGTRPTGHAEISLHGLRWRDRGAAIGALVVDLGEDYRAQVRLAEPDRNVLGADLRFDPERDLVTVDGLDVELGPGVRAQGRGTQRAQWLREGGVAGVHLDLAVGRSGSLAADGGFGVSRRDTLVLSVRDFDLADLAPVLGPSFDGYQGAVHAGLGLVGTLDDVTVEGSVTVLDLLVPGLLRGAQVAVGIEGDGGTLRVEGTVADATAERVRFSGAAPLLVSRQGVRLRQDGPLRLHLAVPPVESSTLSSLLDGRPLPEATASLALDLGGTTLEPTATLTSSLDLPLGGEGPSVRTWLDATLAAGLLSGRVVVNQAFQSRAELYVAVPVHVDVAMDWLRGGRPRPGRDVLLGDLNGSVILKQLPVPTLRRLARVDWDVDGNIQGAFALSGKPWAPRLAGGVNLASARLGDIPVTPATVELYPSIFGYRVDMRLGFGSPQRAKPSGVFARARAEAAPEADCIDGEGSGEIIVRGHVPLGDDFALDKPGLLLEIGGAGLPVAGLEALDLGVIDATGCLVAAGEVTGTLSEPTINVGYYLRDGALTLSPIGLRLDDLRLRGRVQPGSAVVDQVTARTAPAYLSGELRELGLGQGEIDASAKLKLDGLRPQSLEGAIKLDRAWLVATADRRAQVSGELTVASDGRALDARGKVRVDNAYVHLRERFFESSRGTALHPDIHLSAPGASASAVASGSAPGFALALRPKIDVDLARNVRVDVAMPLQGAYGDLARSLSTVVVETDLDGQVRLDHKDNELRITGEVEPQRGRAEVLGRPFDLTEGTVAFTGADYRQPVLDLEAVHASEYGHINVTIGGVAGAPTLDFSSDQVSDEVAIEILVLGKPIAEMEAGEGNGTQALALVSAMLRNEVREGVASTLHLDRVDVTDGMFGVGFALGRNVFLTTAYEFDTDPNTKDKLGVSLEVTLPYRWYLELGTNSSAEASVSAYKKWRF